MWVLRLLLALLLIKPGTTPAQEIAQAQRETAPFRLLEADTVYFEGTKTWHLLSPYWDEVLYRYNTEGNPYPSGEDWMFGVAAGFDLTFVQYDQFRWYWNNRIEGDSTNHQFRRVAWQYETGMSYGKVSAFWKHESQHLLDEGHESFYPLTDRFGVRLYFLGGE